MEDQDNGALARGLAVLRCIAGARRPLANREIVEQTNIPKATVSRITTQLVAANLLRHDADTDRFTLGTGVLDLSRAFLEPLDARTVVRTHLRDFTEAVGASVQLGLRHGLDMVVIETVRPRSAAVVTRLDVGSRMPVAASAMGRAWLAGLPGGERQELLTALMHDAGGGWSASLAAIEHADADIALHGFCASFGDWNPEVNAIGTWLRWPNGELYALSCGGTAYRLPETLLTGPIAERFAAAMESVCRETGATCPLVADPEVPASLPPVAGRLPRNRKKNSA